MEARVDDCGVIGGGPVEKAGAVKVLVTLFINKMANLSEKCLNISVLGLQIVKVATVEILIALDDKPPK